MQNLQSFFAEYNLGVHSSVNNFNVKHTPSSWCAALIFYIDYPEYNLFKNYNFADIGAAGAVYHE